MEKHTNKIVASLSMLAIYGASFVNVASAQTATQNPPPTAHVELAQLLPSDIDQLVEFNTGAPNPFNNDFSSLIEQFTNGGITGMSDQDTATLKDILNKELANNKLTVATKNVMMTEPATSYSSAYTYPSPENYASMHMTSDDYATLVSLLPTDTTVTTVDNMTVYSPSSDTFITMIGDLVVVTGTEDRMTGLLDMYTQKTGTPLAQTDGYMAVRSKDLPGSFLNMYVNPSMYQNSVDASQVLGLGDLLSAEKDLMAALNAEGISVGETDTGFNFSVVVKGDDAKLKQLNLSFDRYNFIPELYRYINSNNVMIFGEGNNLQGKVQDFMKFIVNDAQANSDFTAWKNNFKADSGLDFDADLLPLFQGKYAMSFHKTDQIYPAATLVVDVRTMQSKAGTVLVKLVDYVDKTFNAMEKDSGVDFYNRSIVTSNGTAYYHLTFDPSKSPDADPLMQSLPGDKTLFTVNAAVTTDGLLVITTSPNVNDAYTLDGKGMLNNATFSQAFVPNQSMAGVGYVSFDSIHDYAKMLMDLLSAPSDVSTFINGLLDPWHDVYETGSATSDTVWGSGSVNVDIAGLQKYGELFQNAFQVEQSAQNYQYVPTPKTFCDVRSTDWFKPYVDDLSKDYIISGYSDGCFRPGNAITRAEFIKMVMEAEDMTYTPNYDGTTAYFKDVPADTSVWYAQYINAAASEKYITGYNDGTFHPDDPITRAEAVQILYNVSASLKDVSPVANFTRFSDVSSGDWFTNAIHAAYADGLVQGVSADRFEPHRNITRAEASKIIKLLRDLEFGSAPSGGDVQQPGMLRPIDYTQQGTEQTTGPNVY